MHRDALSLVEMDHWSVPHLQIAAVEFFVSKQSLLQLNSVVSDSRFKDMMLLAAILYCGYRIGVQELSVKNCKTQERPR
jgi:hypothetical protein